MAPPLSFDRLGPVEPATPIVLSVPHAGRDYPAKLIAALAVPLAAARALEDRDVDRVALAALRDETAFLARRPRAWIDLNRREDERDPAVDEGASGWPPTAKLRGGLGLVPRRAGGGEALWRRRWTAAEVEARIAADHRPYHDALARALADARARFGVAVLVDLHSMPPLPGSRAAVVIGDRHGRSADERLVRAALGAAAAAGLKAVRNAPYAGGHVTERHGAPDADVHALQIEIDRTLYLDRRGEPDAAGVARAGALLRDVIDGLERATFLRTAPLAAE